MSCIKCSLWSASYGQLPVVDTHIKCHVYDIRYVYLYSNLVIYNHKMLHLGLTEIHTDLVKSNVLLHCQVHINILIVWRYVS